LGYIYQILMFHRFVMHYFSLATTDWDIPIS